MTDKRSGELEERRRYEEDELVILLNKGKREPMGAKKIEMTSLVDILTILLVFLIKNVSVEAQKVTIPENISLPTTISFDETKDNEGIVVMRVSQQEILIGDVRAGTPVGLLTDRNVANDLLTFARRERDITARGGNVEPVLVLQADRNVRCQIISQIILAVADAEFSGIYFSTVKGEDAQQVFGM